MILEIGFDISNRETQDKLLNALEELKIPYYVEPPNNFNSLEDLECQCEGK